MIKKTVKALSIAALASAGAVAALPDAQAADSGAYKVAAYGEKGCKGCDADKGCNPCGGCNPCAAEGCNPCAGCNPCGGDCNPCGGGA